MFQETEELGAALPQDAARPARDERSAFLADVLEGLGRPRKEIPCKWLYDRRGSHLFEQICELDEYYPTRTELAILERHVRDMAALLGPGCAIVEYGAGTALKTRLLLQHLRDPAAYVPVDISPSALAATVARLARDCPGLLVRPLCADFSAPVDLPLSDVPARRRAVFFPGSTIGNLHKADVVSFLRMVARECGRGGGLLIGVDLRKERAVLESAYDDARGITAAFNLNVLARVNRELGADFDVQRFRHAAHFDDRHGRVEMHLVSTAAQRVEIAGHVFDFAPGETIWTESSYKYDLREFAALAALAGWRCERVWTDERAWFSVQYLTVP